MSSSEPGRPYGPSRSRTSLTLTPMRSLGTCGMMTPSDLMEFSFKHSTRIFRESVYRRLRHQCVRVLPAQMRVAGIVCVSRSPMDQPPRSPSLTKVPLLPIGTLSNGEDAGNRMLGLLALPDMGGRSPRAAGLPDCRHGGHGVQLSGQGWQGRQ